tara:strand:+ start:222 stop:830 length:609 start_codon:yes stop_codon:yes gene_type:complete
MAINVTPIPKLAAMAAPAFVLGTSNAAGDANTVVASNSTLLAFDSTAPSTIAFGASPGAGSGTTASYRNHTHGMAADPSPTEANKAQMEAETAGALYAPPDLIINSPGVSVAWAKVAADGSDTYLQHNVSGLAEAATGVYVITFDVDMADNGYAVTLSCSNTPNAYFAMTSIAGTGSVTARILNSSGTLTSQQFGLIVMGDL